MWCDNCLLLFPLRGGAIALAIFIALYNFAGSILLFMDGTFLYFMQYEPQVYGGIGMAIGFMAVLTVIAFSSQSYMFTRLMTYLGPILIIVSAIKKGLMIFRLNYYGDHVTWECNNGGQIWNSTLAAQSYVPPPASGASTIPSQFCTYGFNTLYLAFAFSLAIDLILQIYLWFMTWRYKNFIEISYTKFSAPIGGIYAA